MSVNTHTLACASVHTHGKGTYPKRWKWDEQKENFYFFVYFFKIAKSMSKFFFLYFF